LSSRRLFRLLAALIVLGVLISAGYAFAQGSSDARSGIEEARRAVASCESERVRQPGPKDFTCPSVDQMRSSFDRRFRYASTIPDSSRGSAVFLLVVSFIVGASFVGAEWGSGAMTTLLTWEPRRGRVLLAKLAACAIVTALAAAFVLALLAIVYWPVGRFRGTTAGVDKTLWWTLAGIWARGAGLAVFGSALAIGIVTIVRNTAGGLAVGFVYGAILDPILAQVFRGRFRPWLLQHNLPRLLGTPVEVVQRGPPGTIGFTQATLSVTRPIVLLSIYAAALVALAYAAFRARDVT
jgi:hypothetical protein